MGFSLSKLFKKAKRTLDKHGDEVQAIAGLVGGGGIVADLRTALSQGQGPGVTLPNPPVLLPQPQLPYGPPPPPKSMPTWVPWAIGGVAVVTLGGVFLGRRRR